MERCVEVELMVRVRLSPRTCPVMGEFGRLAYAATDDQAASARSFAFFRTGSHVRRDSAEIASIRGLVRKNA